MFAEMQQSQVNNSNNTANTMDCIESGTVRTINTRQAQRQKQRSACSRLSKVHSHSATMTSTAAPRLSDATRLANSNFTAGNANNSNVTCPISTTKTAAATATAAIRSTIQCARLSAKTRSPNRRPQMKSVALLPIICFAILAHISSASGRTLHGRKQILHTLENRMHHHNDVIHYEREIAPKHTAPAHRQRQRTIRSLAMNCDEVKSIVESLKTQSMMSLGTLKENVKIYTDPRFNATPETSLKNWSKSKLNLSHPYQKVLDRDFLKEVGNHDFSHLREKATLDESLKLELKKIYTTIRTLNVVIKRLYNETKENKEQMEIIYKKGVKDMIKFLEITRDEIVVNLRITKDALDALKIESEMFDENSVTYNQTLSAKDWLMVVENISFMDYLNQLYTLLLKMCTPTNDNSTQ